MYELDGRAYLLVPIGRPNAGGRGAAAATDAQPGGPSGYVTFALP